jgi:CHRD domain
MILSSCTNNLNLMHPFAEVVRINSKIHLFGQHKGKIMIRLNRTVFNFILGAVTCVLLVVTAAPSYSTTPVKLENAPTTQLIEQHIASNLRHAATAATTKTLMAQASDTPKYVAVLGKTNVVGSTPSTSAFGTAGAVLVGDRLVVRGDFSNLTSPLRDYATDPLDPPNPNITSGIHIHQGAAAANGPFQYALTVEPDETALGGRFSGEYTLTSEQLQALSDGMLYVDLHTQRNRAGELRGILQPY